MIDEALAVIASTHTAVLATLKEDGAPYATPITYAFKDNAFTWWSAESAVHSQNIARDPRVSLAIVDTDLSKKHAVYVNGTAVIKDEKVFNEQWQQELTGYTVALGVIDTDKSSPGRFYFEGDAA